MTITIQTNHHWRNVLHGYELSEHEAADFDYIGPEDFPTHDFIRYKSVVYDLSEFMAWQSSDYQPTPFPDWQGYHSDSHFSGVLVSYSDDFEQVKMATYCC